MWEIEDPPRDVKALGLEDSSFWGASGLPQDLHHQQRRQGAGGGAEPEERGGVPHVLERHLGGPPGLMKTSATLTSHNCCTMLYLYH